MKRIQYYRYGGPEEMRLETYDLPAPDSDEILVQVKASSINPVDWKIRQGAMKLISGGRMPRAMGTDFSGIVAGVGKGVTRFKVGDEVFGSVPIKSSGAFAEQLITQEKLASKKPPSISFAAAATLPIAGTTAWLALVQKGGLQAGQNVFINGAYGGVGQAAIDIAKNLGAVVTGRVSPKSISTAKAELGIDQVLDYTQAIPAELHKTFDIVFDCNGGLTPQQGDALIKSSGVVIDINPSPYKLIRSLYSRQHKFVFGSINPQILEKLAELAAAGKLSISIGRTAKLAEAIALITDLETGRRTKGKAVIITDEG
ncbi:NAD(P)-dependent alcohol dehydrogenase [Methylomonas paludis]|uniref:NAD(P)-dependent alcohol dehydrogenase n=1 Tax=Methylomonas paludis TaxID=1173101 RepID=A0A975MQE2_9GAMM|nr:NAD(P)-dependent alcohol dehydrogenase [Methylomonas paludis]QWF71574.1 NAD(P)-dependent alcohol dehydrogenase [Methylomonas paludis]